MSSGITHKITSQYRVEIEIEEAKIEKAGIFSTCFAHNLCFIKATLLHSLFFLACYCTQPL
jgi:hypothetical protein